MDTVKFVPLLMGLLIAVLMVGAVFVPVISSSTTHTVETTTQINEGAEWLKLGYQETGDYSFNVGFDGDDNFTVGNQNGAYEDLICYADNQRTLFTFGDYLYLVSNGDTPSVHKFTDNANVTNTSGTLTIMDGSNTIYTGASPNWAYVPDTNGAYGFFYDGNLTLDDKPTVAVGSYANVFAFNDLVVDLNGVVLDMNKVGNYADGVVTWESPSIDTDSVGTLSTLDPSIIQPIDFNHDNGVSLMSADPSNGTRIGDLFYTFSGSNATVVGYSSSIDWTTFNTIPDTVENDGVTYTITGIGSSAFANCTNLALTSLPSGLTSIATYGFRGCTNLALTSLPDGMTFLGVNCFENCTNLALTSLPSGLRTISQSSFANCPNLKIISLPENITTISNSCFNGCSGLESIVIQPSITSISSNAFTGTNIKEVLNLGEYEVTTTTGGLNADSVQDYIGAIGYIAPVMGIGYEVVPIDTPVASLMQILPLLAGVGALLLAVSMMIYTRY